MSFGFRPLALLLVSMALAQRQLRGVGALVAQEISLKTTKACTSEQKFQALNVFFMGSSPEERLLRLPLLLQTCCGNNVNDLVQPNSTNSCECGVF